MNQLDDPTVKTDLPAKGEAIVFRAKTFVLRSQRLVRSVFERDIKQFPRSARYAASPVIALSSSKLWNDGGDAERSLTAGKIHNLRVAVKMLNGVEIEAGRVFSFWKQVGRSSRFRGYVNGRELREGCLIPSIGGGLCQLSNALYDAALKANFEIVERHAHTRVVEGSLAEVGRDATVFWNYVDLRFRSDVAFRIEARVDGENLTVKFRSDAPSSAEPAKMSRSLVVSGSPNSCMTCGLEECHRVVKTTSTDFGKTAFLVDEFWPEYDHYLSATKKLGDSLFLPINGRRFRRSNYAWSTDGFRLEQSYLVTAARSYSSRKLAAQGAARQLNLRGTYEKLAKSYSRRLTYEQLHLVIQQDLLPYLWKDGSLGGRSFDVLMTALPMHEIQSRLDQAFLLNPESRTLADFRADRKLIEAENEALANARKIITPHTEIARLFHGKAELLNWSMPGGRERSKIKKAKATIVFPATTVGRKGCYELREALRGLDVRLLPIGPQIEAPDFWKGVELEESTDNWLEKADLVVLPAHIEHKPRRLLLAAAAGIPTIASTACGVSSVAGIEMVTPGDGDELCDKIQKYLADM